MKLPLAVAVIGGGASGMAAAITAAHRGAQVTIFEAQSALGNKILVTGNGRCNLSNLDMDPKFYHSASEAGKNLVASILSQFPADRVIEFFNGIGLIIGQGREPNCLYPVTKQALSVRQALIAAVCRYGIRVITDSYIDENGLHNIRKQYDKVIIATGSIAGLSKKALGLVGGDTYLLPQSLGQALLKPLPALTGMRCDGNYWKKISGIRINANVSFYSDNLLAADFGEVQLTDFGLSGIAVFNCSHAVGRALECGKNIEARLDFLPFIKGDLGPFVAKRLAIFKGRAVKKIALSEFFIGLINERLADAVMSDSGMDYSKKQDLEDGDLFRRCIMLLKDFRARVSMVNGFDKAQIASGGIDCAGILPSLESAYAKGVYFCGEVMDVDGICGGYNLHWAWASGIRAGALA